jgi:hypothetical protein
MAEAVLKNVAPLALLERVSPELLLRFLRPYEAYLQSRGVPVEGISPDSAWVRKLHAALQQVDPEMPTALQQGLVDIADLATEQGLEQALRVSNKEQLNLFTKDSRVDIIDAPFRMYLDHPREFRASKIRLQATRVERFIEFHPRTSTLMPPLTDAHQKRLREECAKFFASRNRTDFCELQVVESEPEILFVVIHGRAPKTHGIIRSSTDRSRLSYVRDKHDVILYDKRSGQLSVSAQYPVEQEFYRRTFGRVFFRTLDHFATRMLLTGRPLLDLGATALSAAGLPGIRFVRLRQLRIKEHDGRGTTVTFDALDLRHLLAQSHLLELLGRGEVLMMKFDIHLEGQKKAVSMQLVPPNRLTQDRRVGAALVRSFLLERRFLLMPEVERPMLAAE